MDHYMPEIFWHDRKGILSVDMHPAIKDGKYKLVTTSVQTEVRIWEIQFENVKDLSLAPLSVNFVANLTAHLATTSVARFCPNPELNLLASGDSHGRIAVWQLSDEPVNGPPSDDLPPNKENWIRIKVLNHESDVNSLAWSPCGKFLASVSTDDSLLVHEALTGKRTVSVSCFRHRPNGLSWDPKGKYLVTMSLDRKMDLVDAAKGTRLRTFGNADFPRAELGMACMEEKNYRLFHDDQLLSFQRGVSFSPCGQIIVAPCAHFEIGANDVYGSLVFKRSELEKDRPSVLLPSNKPTFMVKFSPIIFELDKDIDENYLGLPYRLMWVALTKESVLFYDSQHELPIGLVENIHYNNLTDASWSPDGRTLIISSLEGYCTFLRLKLEQWGSKLEVETLPECPPSPQLIKKRQKKEKKEKEVKVKDEGNEEIATPNTPGHGKLTPLRNTQPSTPKSASLLKFLKKSDKEKTTTTTTTEDKQSARKEKDGDVENQTNKDKTSIPEVTTPKRPAGSANGTPTDGKEAKVKRRIDLITLQ